MNHYEVLEIDRFASQEDIREAYRKLAKKYHPDNNPGDKEAEERFKKIVEAYNLLSDEEKKAKYDRITFEMRSKTGETGELKRSAKNTYRGRKFDPSDITSTHGWFSEVFGINPNNENTKPMKTKDAFETIFGKIRF